jgi:hypothetical protein
MLKDVIIEMIGCKILTLRALANLINYTSDAIGCVSAPLRQSTTTAGGNEATPLEAFINSLQQDCRFYKERASSLRETVSELHSILSVHLGAKQANSVNQLTLLAAFFLPLSLAAGVLSMQTRFADLNLLLYDFVGVVLIVGTIAVCFAMLSRYGPGLYRLITLLNYGDQIYNRAPVLRRVLEVIPIALWWLALLVSFLVGMLKDTVFGVKVLGFEAAGITGLWLLSLKGVRMCWDSYQSTH